MHQIICNAIICSSGILSMYTPFLPWIWFFGWSIKDNCWFIFKIFISHGDPVRASAGSTGLELHHLSFYMWAQMSLIWGGMHGSLCWWLVRLDHFSQYLWGKNKKKEGESRIPLSSKLQILISNLYTKNLQANTWFLLDFPMMDISVSGIGKINFWLQKLKHLQFLFLLHL